MINTSKEIIQKLEYTQCLTTINLVLVRYWGPGPHETKNIVRAGAPQPPLLLLSCNESAMSIMHMVGEF